MNDFVKGQICELIVELARCRTLRSASVCRKDLLAFVVSVCGPDDDYASWQDLIDNVYNVVTSS